MFCRLLRSGFGELILVMECDLGYSMDILYEQCESQFWWRIGVELFGERRDVEKRKLYKAG
jgi:hypothetical protein